MAYQGKNVVITGGTGGIGLGIARQLLIEGAAVRIFAAFIHDQIISIHTYF